MVAPTLRMIHKKNLRGADADGACTKEDFKDDERPRGCVFGGGGGGKPPQQRPHTAHHSTAVLDALSDKDSELSKYLLCDGADAQRLVSLDSAWYTLALEPIEVRNERIIMLFEAYSIFGALFLGAVWTIYEWGNANDNEEVDNIVVNRAFECIMAIALCSNIFLTINGVACWMMSIMIDSRNEEFVFESRTILTNLQNMLMFTSSTVAIGLFIGIYKNLSPNLPEVIVTLAFAIVIYLGSSRDFGRHMSHCMPLEFWHFPTWVQAMMGPEVLVRSKREKLKVRAQERARLLRERAYNERDQIDPNFYDSNTSGSNNDSIGGLLRTAARRVGRQNEDTTIYEERLEADWFNEVEQLRGRDAECLSRYMPLRLAEEVHTMIREGEGDVFYDPSSHE